MHEACEEDGTGDSGHILVIYDRESSVVLTGLPLGPRGSGAANTVAASGNSSFEGPPPALEKGIRARTRSGGAADKYSRRAQSAMARNVQLVFRSVVQNRW